MKLLVPSRNSKNGSQAAVVKGIKADLVASEDDPALSTIQESGENARFVDQPFGADREILVLEDTL